jgi:hypothetical protein
MGTTVVAVGKETSVTVGYRIIAMKASGVVFTVVRGKVHGSGVDLKL